MHWAEQFAKQAIEKNPGKNEYVVESGITPSGVVHAGNFREVMTQELVYKALLKEGVKAKYLYIWDDYDRLRKVPKGVDPKWEKYIGIPVCDVPDPWGCHGSYSEHFASKLIEENKRCGVHAEYVWMSEKYRACEFAEEMKTVLEKKDLARGILNEYRKEPYPESWMPVRVYCEKCGKDTTESEYPGGYNLRYKCECGAEGEFDFREKGIAKMKWRVCWAQRWKHYGVDFESSGKDHQASGGSWDTGKRLCKEVFGHEPPLGPMYEFIYAKGQKEKMSSSMGNVFTVSDLLDIYEPEMVRWIYTGKINHAIEVPFDLGVLNYYSNYDKVERIYFGKEALENEKDVEHNRAVYELSRIGEIRETAQPPFGFCASVVQVSKDEGHSISILQKTGHVPEKPSEESRARVALRLKLAKNWVEKYAPEEAKLAIQGELPPVELSEDQKKAMGMLADSVAGAKSPEEVGDAIKGISEKTGLSTKEIFEAAYLLILNAKRGPRLAPFLLSLEGDFVDRRLRLLS